jgi:hypothetical protein
MNCCTYECNEGRDCPVRASRLKQRNGGESVSFPKTERRKALGYGLVFALICIAAALAAGVSVVWPL